MEVIMRIVISKMFLLFFISISMSYAHSKIKYPCSENDKKEMTTVIQYTLDHGNSAIPSSGANIMHEQCLNNFASAMIHAKKNETDNAIVYLQKVNGKWKVLTLGTDFGDSLDKLNIPKKLQDATAY